MGSDFHVFLSYNSQDKLVVRKIATALRDLGFRPWLDEDELVPGRPWAEALEEIIETCRTAAVLVGPSGFGHWQKPEMWACISEFVNRKLPVLPVLLPGAPEEVKLPLLLKGFTWVDLRRGLAGESWDRLIWGITGVKPNCQTESPAASVTRPGLMRKLLDRLFPRLHSTLTFHHTLPEPPELKEIRTYLSGLMAHLGNDLQEKTRLPLHARTIPAGPGSSRSKDPFVRPIHRVIRQVLGQAVGGDSANAQIAAVNRKSKLVKNIASRLLKSQDPLVLLGDPGSGKTITLQETAFDLARSELRRVFPTVTLYVRLGEFHVEGERYIGPAEVLDYVKKVSPPIIQPWIEGLETSGRLVVLFDGMDEMSRTRYNEHTEALSLFAASRHENTRTLFSCRITDFSPAFIHSRLVLLPFDRSQIGSYLKRFLQVRSIQIDDTTWSISDLAQELASGKLPIDAANPFILSLLCLYLQEERMWPESRVQLLRSFLDKTYERKQRDGKAEGRDLPPAHAALREWARIAFILTERNLGAAIPVEELIKIATGSEEAERTQTMIRAGKECGVLIESIPEEKHLIRFEHHRLQEYFTGLWIYENETPINWLNKLGAPRWQETMINLVLMGGAEDGVKALSDSIETGIPAFHEPGQQVPYEREVLLAERIELGARLLLHSADNSAAVSGHLRPCLAKAVGSLIEHGNPLTQVKMMRACQNLKDISLLDALEKPLRSEIRWVRNQALILVAGPGLLGRSDLATEMGIDLATNNFLPRWPAYIKALKGAGKPSAWASFLLATVCALANLVLLLICAWGLFEALQGLLPVVFRLELPPYTREVQGLLTLGVTAFALRTNRALLWAWILGSVPVGLFLINTAFVLWKSDWFLLPGVFMISGGLCFLLSPLLIVLGLLFHQGTLTLYSVASLRSRNSRYTTSSFLSLAWTECDFELLPDLLKGFGGIMAVGLLVSAVGGSLWYLFVEILPRASERLRFSPWVVPTVLFSALLALIFVGPSAYRLAREQIKDPSLTRLLNSVLGPIARVGTRVKTALGTRAGLRKTSAWVFLRLAGCLGFVSLAGVVPLVLPLVSTFLAKLLVILGLLAAMVLLGYEIFHWTRAPLTALRSHLPSSWLPSDWKSALHQGPQGQNEILRRSTHQALGLKPEAFLQLLVEIEPLIREEPSLSTYLGRRDQLEQALRQERSG